MIFRQLFDAVSSTYTYIIGDAASRQAAIVDPVIERLDQYLQLLTELDLQLIYAMDTHVHADHITAIGQLAQKTGAQTVIAKEAGIDDADVLLTDQMVISVGEVNITARYTPGHTSDSYCYVLSDRVLTGDTLLIRKTGRTDFQSGSSYDQYKSIFDILMALPDETLVFPGHDYSGMMVSTIREERRHNPRLQVSSAEEYAQVMDNLNLDKPKLIDVAVPANQKLGLS